MLGVMRGKKNKINLYIPLTSASIHAILYIEDKERGCKNASTNISLYQQKIG